jgi:2-iminobutanoate/2-iminopropanoate deaminase
VSLAQEFEPRRKSDRKARALALEAELPSMIRFLIPGGIVKDIVSAPNAPKAIGPYSQAVRAEGFVFVSGQIALDPDSGRLVEGDAIRQTGEVLENLKAILEAGGSSLDKVLKTTLYLKSIRDFDEVNEVYETYFHVAPPARATVEVSRLPKDACVEIDAVALA